MAILGILLKKYSELTLKNWIIHVEHSKSREEDFSYLLTYLLLGLGFAVPVYCRLYLLLKSNLHLCLKLHADMLARVLNAPINLYHDVTSSGLILNRFSKDMATLLLMLFQVFYIALQVGNFVGTGFITLYSFWPSFFGLPFILFGGYYVSGYWTYSGREVKRVMSKTKTPIVNTVIETAEGASVIRAMNYTESYKNKIDELIVKDMQAKLFYGGVNGFFKFVLGNIVFVCTTFVLVLIYLFGAQIGSYNIGLLLSEAVFLPTFLSAFLNDLTSFEFQMVAFERCLELTEVIQEDDSKVLVNGLGAKGEVEFSNVSVRYREGLDLALRKVSFKVKEGEKVGLCGRTGSGKSTICLSLFRIIEAEEGKISIDGRDLKTLSLDLLRRGLTVIPQDSFLFKGSLRYNIDPVGLSSDQEIEQILSEIGCEQLLTEKGLDLEIREGGSNLSIGERQLVCITRAITRKSKIVVMDEATASIDFETEKIIQSALKKALKGCTVITVAHRIKTIIDYDKCFSN